MAEIDITRIAGNIGAMNALNSLQGINKQLATYQTRLATGKRINSAADDPAGLSIATKLQSRSEGLKVALGNIGDAKNLLAVAESGLSRINDILLQMRNKALQGASDTMGSAERDIIKTQLTAFAAQIDDLVDQTKWNDTKLLDSTTDFRFQTGADSSDAITFTAISGIKAADLEVEPSGITTGSATAAEFTTYLGKVESAMTTINTKMSNLGSLIGRLSFKEDQVAAAQINVEAAYNRIMNANMAEEQVNASKYLILQQTATAMLAQANTAPQFLLSLFR
ncbi:flagellin [Bellilinea sp.]|uniref:Flagellin n=1 Tax=Bellilinea caldifistulae TaxID=360411 RepID=A0A7C4KZ06_9CHLR